MSCPVSDDVRGSAGITAEPDLQLRLVVAPDAGDVSAFANTGLMISPIEEAAGKLDPPASPPSSSRLERKDKKNNDQPLSPSPAAAADGADNDDDDDGRVATEDEVRRLLHVVDRVPARLWVACIAGVLERFVWYGATAPLREWKPGGVMVLGWLKFTRSLIPKFLQRTTCRTRRAARSPGLWACSRRLPPTS